MQRPAFPRSTLAAAAVLFATPFAAQALPTRIATSAADALDLLRVSSAGALVNAARPVDAYASVHALPGALLVADGASGAPLARAQNFLASYGVLSGVTDPVNQLVQKRVSTDRAGITHVHLDQMQSGLPVFGARLVVHMTDAGVVGVNGVFIPGLESLSITPQMSTTALRERALVAAKKLHPTATNLSVEASRLMFYRTGLLKSAEGENYLAYEVIVKGGNAAQPVRERFVLNANKGGILNRINEIHTVLNRAIFTPNQDVPAVLTETTPTPLRPADPPLMVDDRTRTSSRVPNTPQNNLFIFAGGTWALYKNLFGADSYDFTRPNDPQQQRSVYLVNDQCPNAYWNGDSTNYCPGFDADDVVSHEWSHAYTEYTSGLVYQYQSGALNESYSDIFGETYDLTNNLEGPLGVTLDESETYDNNGGRWVVGEDLSQAAATLLLRDMWDPDNFGNPLGDSPGSTITSPNYYCDTGDNGGVHTNSGVPNHAYAMLVDGKEFNGVTIPAVGMTKAAHIYFQAQSQYQTPTSNFTAHADALEQSCRDLMGATLNDVTGAASTERITAADCAAVTKAIAAVEFRSSVREKCMYVNVLKTEASTPALCGAGLFVNPTFSEGFDGAAALPAGWTQDKNLTGDLDLPPWTTSTDLPAPHTGRAAFFPNNGEGTCVAGGDASASHFLDTPAIPVTTAADRFNFTHFMQSEAGFDGGNLKVSVNGGDFELVPQTAFLYNEHSGEFGAAPIAPGVPDPVGLGGNNTSPNAGELAWTGSDQGEATGSWGTTIVDLSKLTTVPTVGQTVKFRFDFANDGCGGNRGWYVEDVQAYSCKTTAPAATGSSSSGGGSTSSSSGAVSSSSSGGSTSSSSSSSGAVSSSSGTTGTMTMPAEGVTTSTVTSGGATGGRFGGGAFGLFLLAPLAAFGLRRRKPAVR